MDQSTTLATPVSLNRRLSTFSHALLFVLGFSLVFVIGWGGATTLLGGVFGAYKTIIAKIGGVVVIIFGLVTLGIVNIPWLSYDTRPEWQVGNRNGLISSSLMGVFFAAGWTPCIGTTLGAILTLGVSQETSGQAMFLSGFYSLGLGIPFLAIGLGMDRATNFIRRFQRYMRGIQIVSGLFLILIGIMILTNQIFLIAVWAQRNGFFLDLPIGVGVTPSILIAFVAGLLSFLSPCVLPLVPAYLGYLSGHAFSGKMDKST
jgi:cytochrome c-type biogenesis protein